MSVSPPLSTRALVRWSASRLAASTLSCAASNVPPTAAPLTSPWRGRNVIPNSSRNGSHGGNNGTTGVRMVAVSAFVSEWCIAGHTWSTLLRQCIRCHGGLAGKPRNGTSGCNVDRARRVARRMRLRLAGAFSLPTTDGSTNGSVVGDDGVTFMPTPPTAPLLLDAGMEAGEGSGAPNKSDRALLPNPLISAYWDVLAWGDETENALSFSSGTVVAAWKRPSGAAATEEHANRNLSSSSSSSSSSSQQCDSFKGGASSSSLEPDNVLPPQLPVFVGGLLSRGARVSSNCSTCSRGGGGGSSGGGGGSGARVAAQWRMGMKVQQALVEAGAPAAARAWRHSGAWA